MADQAHLGNCQQRRAAGWTLSLSGDLWWNARRGLAAAGVVLLGGALRTPAEAQQLKRVVDRPVLASLRITGNENLTTAELKAAMVTLATHARRIVGVPMPFFKKQELLDRAELDRDLLRLRVLYWKRGWRAAQVTPTLTKRDAGGVDLTLKVIEGPPTLIGALQLGPLDTLLDAHGLRTLITARVGQPLDLIRLDSIAVRIVAHLDAEGFGDVTISVVPTVDPNSPRATVSMAVAKLYQTTVESVRVEGTEHFDQRVVANTMQLKEGDRYSRIGVIESQRARYEAGFFKRAYVRVDPGSRDSLKKLVASVEEVEPRLFRITGGVSTVDFFQVDARYTNANFRGNASRLGIQGTVGNILAAQLNDNFVFKNVLPKDVLSENQPKFLQPTFQLNADIRRRWLRETKASASTHMDGRT